MTVRSHHRRGRSTDPGAGWVFSQLILPRPLEIEQVEALILRLAADRAAPPLVLEARSACAGRLRRGKTGQAAQGEQYVRHLIGTPAEHVRWLQRTVRQLLPGSDLIGGAERPPVVRAVRLRMRPRAFALAPDRAELTSAAVLSALDARLHDGEHLVLQLILGQRLLPRHLPKELPDPAQPWWQLPLSGVRSADRSVRDQIDARSGQHGFDATLRLGVTADTPERRQQLTIGLLGALSTAGDRGTYLDLTLETPNRLNAARLPWRWPLRLGATEVVGLLGWPLGDADLPGVPPLHPKPLRVPAAVSRTERLFAVAFDPTSCASRSDSTGPGILDAAAPPGGGEFVGIAASDLTAHALFVGPTGTGKTTALLNLVAADVADERAVLVIDPKEQFVADILERAVPAGRMDDVVIIDPGAVRSGHVAGFNPLDIGDRDPDVVVDGLMAVLAAVFHDGWGPRTEDILHAGLLTLARAGGQRSVPFTLLDLPRLLTEQPFRSSVVGQVLDDPGLRLFWGWYLAQTPSAQAQAIAAPLNKLRQYLLRPSLRAILGQAQPAFRLRDVFRDNKIVLVPLNEALIGPKTAQLLGSLIVAETWSATLERAREHDPGNRPASVYVDEVQEYLHLPTSIDDALSRSRSLGVGWHLTHQHRAQLPSALRSAVDSNAKSKVVFQPLDPDDAAAFARQAPDLKPIDFLSLGRFQAYANLTAHGSPAGWALVVTRPKPEPTGLGRAIRARSRELYAAPVSLTDSTDPTPAPPTSPSTSATPGPASNTPPDVRPVGRKRRQP